MPKPHLQRVILARKLRKDMTGAELKLWSKLRGHRFLGLHFRRQVPCGPYFADFLCQARRLIIEVDGATHSAEAELQHDALRTRFLSEQGFHVMRFYNDEIYHNLEGALETIANFLKTWPPP